MNNSIGDRVDLTNCDREPIHLLGRVQTFGFLVGVDGDWMITHVSANAAAFTGREPAELIGQSATELMSAETLHSVRNRLQFLRPRRGVEVVYGVGLLEVESQFDVSVHTVDGIIIMEFEPASPPQHDMNEVSQVRLAVDQIADLSDMDRIFSTASRFVRMVTGFDRVMLYRFDIDGAGEVVGEARKQEMQPFLHLRYPASDIPRQARALYIENPIRLIADASDNGVPVLSGVGQVGAPLDLSGSRLRSVSPIHLEYLRNMGVAASMSISIIVHGQLWGLIACHHGEPHVPNMHQRSCALLFGQMLSLVLQTKFSDEERANDRRVSELTEQISREMSAGTTTPGLLRSSAEAFSAVLNADGFAVVQSDAVVTGGSAPDAEDVLAICDRLNSLPGNEVFSTHVLTTFIGTAERFGDRSAGVLSIPISRSPHDYILFFRQELVRMVQWAGNPEKPATTGPNGDRLTPRKSFETWQTTVRGQSAPWRPSDLRAASQLRVMLLEVVLRITEEAQRERKLANERQELLIAELNHRVRNILGLVRGLISQTNSAGENTADFVKKLDQRVQALARAHDQITRQNWQPAAFSKLVAIESETYLVEKKDRITIEGPEVLLSPQAFSSMALVIHELLTNSAKYGAMSDRHGSVKITVAVDPAGLSIEWRESGGPAVRAPERRGFGSTIIERTVPFELKGEAEISYRLDGVVASFRLPKIHISSSDEASVVSKPASRVAPQRGIAAPNSVLVVEDNLIIAMDAEDIFLGMGSRDVAVAGSVDAALLEILRRPFDFALLDINLGSETSFPIARELKRLGVPFVFASGYGDGAQFPDDLAGTRMINKPYERMAINGLFS